MSTNEDKAVHAPTDHYEVGQVLGGKYELLGKAGEGATGTVWIALNTALQSKVAIKLVHPEMRLPMVVERVMREARAAARLTHSAIVRVFDLGETEHGDPYIVMELLEGESLRSRLDREVRLTPEQAIAVLLPLASALSLAHGQGIVHRDIKPDNIMLAQTDGGRIQPKIVDFGIAKMTFGDADGVTTGALVIGTPGYMSPEQAGGGEVVDHHADVWSFCALLYEMVSGDTPFPSINTLEALCSVIRDPVPSLLGNRVKDEALWAILERGLKKDPRERWQSMRELGEALSDWLATRGVAEDISGVPLRALWLGAHSAPPQQHHGRSTSFGKRSSHLPPRARSEEPVVANSVLFSEVSGQAPSTSSRSRYLVMAGLALLTGALAWKIAFSPVNHAVAASSSTASVAAVATAAPLPAPVVAPPPPVVTATLLVTHPSATASARPAAPAAPKTVAAKIGRNRISPPSTSTTPGAATSIPTATTAPPAGAAPVGASTALPAPTEPGATPPSLGQGPTGINPRDQADVH